MNKAEVLEIRKQFTPDRCSIDQICGCYVDHEKNKKLTFRKAFLSLPEDETYKYFDIFKHALSGTFGRNLLNLAFPLQAEEIGGAQEFLLTLRNSGLKDDALLDQFYDRVIENYVNPENYYIILIHCNYDIPGITSDRMEMEDASEEVFSFLLCAICPVTLSKAALSYNDKTNEIEDRFRDWVVDPPVKGFLFPAFNDRSTDLHNMLYYSKKPDDLQDVFVEVMFGVEAPMSAPDQKETFQTLLTDTMGPEGSYDVVRNIHENLQEMIDAHKEDPEPLELDKKDVKALLQESGVPEARMADFDENYAKCAGDEDYPLLAGNITGGTKFKVETPDVVIRVNPDRSDLVRTQMIDGRQCLVIAVDDHIEVNGMNVWTLLRGQHNQEEG